jgi:hypothetical protein
VDDQALFCNRCGTPFSQPATAEKLRKKAPGSVIITKKKNSVSPPAPGEAFVPEDLPSDPQGYLTAAPAQVQKKFAHLPLVADELKVEDSPQRGFYSTGIREPSSLHQKKGAPKKGVLGMFKR